jgi:hypothetical protein
MDPTGLEHLAQMKDIGLHRCDKPARRLLPPQRVPEPSHRYHAVGRGEQQEQDGALLMPTERKAVT